ncbi:PD-(D/E)XK nuclease family transposase [Psychrobacillus sp. NPDC096389]|uniref:PD-(D/E)XK nuclease family transposase n=1 Tax=Psychrobacillus sp. NPDC096389 TaxID=3364490 RepID=UPI0037FA5BB6
MRMEVNEFHKDYMQNSLDLRNMYVFKKIFRKAENYDLLLDFIRPFLDLNIIEVERVKDSNYLGHEFFEEFSVDVKTDKGKLYNIEIHLIHSEKYYKQMTMTWEKEYVRQVVQGNIGHTPKIVMYFFDFSTILDSRHKMQKAITHDGSCYSDHYEVHAIHMKYFAIVENNSEKRKWLDFFIGDQEAKQALAAQYPLLQKTLKALNELNEDEVTVQEAADYYASLQKVYFYRYDSMDTSEWESQMDLIHELVSSSCPMSYQETADHLGIPMIEVIAKSNMYYFF